VGVYGAGSMQSEGPLAGLQVVVTGLVPGMTRAEAAEAVAAAGGVSQTAVSGKTNLLVCGEEAGQRKLEAAAERGIYVVDADRFLRILAGDQPPPIS